MRSSFILYTSPLLTSFFLFLFTEKVCFSFFFFFIGLLFDIYDSRINCNKFVTGDRKIECNFFFFFFFHPSSKPECGNDRNGESLRVEKWLIKRKKKNITSHGRLFSRATNSRRLYEVVYELLCRNQIVDIFIIIRVAKEEGSGWKANQHVRNSFQLVELRKKFHNR